MIKHENTTDGKLAAMILSLAKGSPGMEVSDEAGITYGENKWEVILTEDRMEDRGLTEQVYRHLFRKDPPPAIQILGDFAAEDHHNSNVQKMHDGIAASLEEDGIALVRAITTDPHGAAMELLKKGEPKEDELVPEFVNPRINPDPGPVKDKSIYEQVDAASKKEDWVKIAEKLSLPREEWASKNKADLVKYVKAKLSDEVDI